MYINVALIQLKQTDMDINSAVEIGIDACKKSVQHIDFIRKTATIALKKQDIFRDYAEIKKGGGVNNERK